MKYPSYLKFSSVGHVHIMFWYELLLFFRVSLGLLALLGLWVWRVRKWVMFIYYYIKYYFNLSLILSSNSCLSPLLFLLHCLIFIISQSEVWYMQLFMRFFVLAHSLHQHLAVSFVPVYLDLCCITKHTGNPGLCVLCYGLLHINFVPRELLSQCAETISWLTYYSAIAFKYIYIYIVF